MTARIPSAHAFSAAGSNRLAWLEPLLAVLVFLLPLLNALPFGPAGSWAFILIVVLTLGLLAAGLALGLPRWSMPVTGAWVFVLAFYGLALLLSRLKNNPISAWEQSRAVDARLAYAIITGALFWLGYLLLAGLLALAARAVERALLRGRAGAMPRFWPRERDRSALSFLLFGFNAPLLLLALDDFAFAGPLMLVVVVVLVDGVLLYLRASQPDRRILALAGTTLMAGAVLAAGKWALIPMQDWGSWFQGHPVETERWFAAVNTLENAIFGCIVVALPGLLVKQKRRGNE